VPFHEQTPQLKSYGVYDDNGGSHLYNLRMLLSPEAADLALRLERIQQLVDQLAKVRGDVVQQQALSDRSS
jgi:hypothetical protein